MKRSRAWTLIVAAVAASLSSGVVRRACAAEPGGSKFDSAEALLVALETADRDIRTLQAGVRYIRRMALQGDEQTRQGRLVFEQVPADDGATRLFAVLFDTLYVGDRREKDRQEWIFNGQWLIERRPDRKQYVARQIAPPGEHIDPLRLGEGPMPLPIGQRAADVLARYSAQIVNPHSGIEDEPGAVQEFVRGTVQLRLTPTSPSEDDFREVRLWYDEATLLPRLAKTFTQSGDESFVMLVNIRVNERVRGDMFSIEPPAEKDGWEVQIEEYQR